MDLGKYYASTLKGPLPLVLLSASYQRYPFLASISTGLLWTGNAAALHWGLIECSDERYLLAH